MKNNNPDQMDFEWSWCPVCECATINCPVCGNNCCNGGYGCDFCESVYKYLDDCYAKENCPKSEEEVSKYNEEK